MSIVAKLTFIAALGSNVLGTSLAPAYAFKMPETADARATAQQQAVSAYAGNAPAAGIQDAAMLSPNEINHIRWCAAHYGLAYNPTSDTYTGSGGVPVQCRSPR